MRTTLLHVSKRLSQSRLRPCLVDRIIAPIPQCHHRRRFHIKGVCQSELKPYKHVETSSEDGATAGDENSTDAQPGGDPTTKQGWAEAIDKQYGDGEVALISRKLQRIFSDTPTAWNSEAQDFNMIAPNILAGPFVVNAQNGKVALLLRFGVRSKGNSLDQTTLRSLSDCLKALTFFPQICAAVLMGHRGPGRPVFSAGANLATLDEIKDSRTAKEFINSVRTVGDRVRDLPFPSIACINGPCIGAGLEIAASCDIRYATMNSSFSMPEVLLNIPSVVQARLLPDIVGWGRARELMLTGRSWSTQEAHTAGLISMIFESEELALRHLTVLCNTFTQHSDAVNGQKALFRDWESRSIDEGMDISVEAFASVFESQNDRNRVSAAIHGVRKRA